MRSMTGFSSGSISNDKYDIEMEIKSVNSRYFEFKLKTSSYIDSWENEIKNVIYNRLKRGKFDVYVKITEKNNISKYITINKDIALLYLENLRQLSKFLKIRYKPDIKDILNLPNVLQIDRQEYDESLLNDLKKLTDDLVVKMIDMMNIEGQNTVEDILKSIKIIEEQKKNIEQKYPDFIQRYKTQLQDRIREIIKNENININENLDSRILIEVDLVALRSAINEEIIRLDSHLKQFKDIINGVVSGDSKKLDFIAQEMMRETNTIASKSSDYEIINSTIEIKSEIEKIREQLRNLE